MLYCDDPTLERWIAPTDVAYPELSRPTWTRLMVGHREISNSIEWAHWETEPIMPIVCDQCGVPACAKCSLTRIVALPDQLLWVRPLPESAARAYGDNLEERNYLGEAVVIPRATWDRLRDQFPNLPASGHYPPATRRDLAWMWLSELPEGIRVPRLEDLERQLRQALASDPLELDPARQIVRDTVSWLRGSPDAPVSGRIVRVEVRGRPVNTFYLDGPSIAEWPAFVVGEENGLAFSQGWIFQSH